MRKVDVGFQGEDSRVALLKFGPSIKVHVSSYTNPQGEPAAGAASRIVAALIDTGAEESCIDTQLATQLNLPIIDEMYISGAGGQQVHPVYLARVTIPDLGMTQHGRFAGVELAAGQQPHGVLLGRTFLAVVHLSYHGPSARVTVSIPEQ